MDPWSKVDYSRIIREASMRVDPPSDRVPGRGLLVLPILEARRRRNRGEIAEKGSVFRISATGDKYRRRRAPRGPLGVKAAPWRGPTQGRAGRVPGALVGPLRPPFGAMECSVALIFYWIFPEFLEHF